MGSMVALMGKSAGKTRALSAPRRLIVDLLHFAKRVPSIPVERTFHLGPLGEVRGRTSPAPSWTSLFLKAFGLLAREFPELRTSYLSAPYPRLFEHEGSVASLAMEKVIGGENAILFLKLREPEAMTLAEIHEKIQTAKQQDPDQNANFRLALGISRLPVFLRRLLWWVTLEWSGPWRARKFGTFGVTSYGALGADSLHPLSPLTATLNFGPISSQGSVRVRIIYDHRVCDGAQVARALARLEAILLGEIRQELQKECEANTGNPPDSGSMNRHKVSA